MSCNRAASVVACSGLVIAAALALAAPAGAAEKWSRVFASETDPMVWLTTDGVMLRSPFSFTSPETLWRSDGHHKIARARVSPDGRWIAWIERKTDQDSTFLWAAGPRPARRLAGYMAVQPQTFGVSRYEPETPSRRDAEIHGARLVQPGTLSNRLSTNVLEWTLDARRVVVADTAGIMLAGVEDSSLTHVAQCLATSLRTLDPAPIYLGAFITRTDLGVTQEEPLLVYPAYKHWRIFTSAGFHPGHPWTSSITTVWWASGPNVVAIQAHDPTPVVQFEADDIVLWMGYDENDHTLRYAAGNELRGRPDGSTVDTLLARFSEPIHRVIPLSGTRGLAVITEGKLYIYNGDSKPQAVALGSAKPDTIFDAENGDILLGENGGNGSSEHLYIANFKTQKITATDSPHMSDASLALTPSRRFVLLFKAAAKPPATLQVYDVESKKWVEVDNPGVVAWEPMSKEEARRSSEAPMRCFSAP